jgi:hypothetical protein
MRNTLDWSNLANMEWRMCQIKYPKDREFFATPRIRCAAPQEAASFTRVFLIDDPPQTLSSKLICGATNKVMRTLR